MGEQQTWRERLEQSSAVPTQKVPVQCEVWSVPVPLDAPIGASTVATFDTVHHLVVVLRSEGLMGWGYSASPAPMVQEAVEDAVGLVSAVPTDLGALLRVELDQMEPSSVVPDHRTRIATNAIAVAAWDLAAKRAGMSCAAAWGAGDADELECYMSSRFYVNRSESELAEAAEATRREHFRHVKVRTGKVAADDARRVRIVCEHFPEDGAVAVDALHGWTVAETRTFVDEVGASLLWVEDPVPDEQLGELRDLPQPLAAGESLVTATELRELTEAARVDLVLPDVMVVGGPAHFLSIADDMRGTGTRVGAHLFAEASAHLLACIDQPGPVEVFTWSDPLFVAPPRPGPSGRLAVSGPGFGFDLNEEALVRFGDRVATLAS